MSVACDTNFHPQGGGAAPAQRTAPVVAQVAAPKVEAAARELYKVPLGDSPARGPGGAKVTMVVFSEFQCPYCAQVAPTVEALASRYGEDLQIVWKHLPLGFHDRAVPAALAAEAARVQGKFWPMHDRLFGEQGKLGNDDFQRHARALGLDLAKFSAALGDAGLRARVDADQRLGESLGVRGTPTFFINGRRLVGAQPLDRFAELVDEERARADEKLRAGVSRAQLYAALTEGGLDKAAPPAGRPAGGPAHGGPAHGGADRADPSRDTTVHKVEVGNAPTRGAANAPITLVIFSDFECPFCKKVETTIEALEKAYPGKIRVAWKNFPLGFHANARPAAVAALVAHRSGKFWAMHDRLLAQQDALDPSTYERYARELGLDVAAFKAGLVADEPGAQVDADLKQGAALGVSGTPTVFINGRRVAGAHPLETFRAIVDQELAKAGG